MPHDPGDEHEYTPRSFFRVWEIESTHYYLFVGKTTIQPRGGAMEVNDGKVKEELVRLPEPDEG